MLFNGDYSHLVMVAIKISNLKAHHLSFRLIIFGIVERKIVYFGFINGDFALSGIYLEVLDGINLGVGKLFWEQGHDLFTRIEVQHLIVILFPHFLFEGCGR